MASSKLLRKVVYLACEKDVKKKTITTKSRAKNARDFLQNQIEDGHLIEEKYRIYCNTWYVHMYKYTHFICATLVCDTNRISNKTKRKNIEKEEMEREKTSAGENGHRKTLIQTEVCKCGVTTVQLERHLNVTIECIFFFLLYSILQICNELHFQFVDYTLSIL